MIKPLLFVLFAVVVGILTVWIWVESQRSIDAYNHHVCVEVYGKDENCQ